MRVDRNALELFFSTLKRYDNKIEHYEDGLSWIIRIDAVKIKGELLSKGIVCELNGNELIIELQQQSFSTDVTYFSEEKYVTVIDAPEIERPFVLISKDFSFIVHDPVPGKIFLSAGLDNNLKKLYKNSVEYYKLYNEFKSPEFSQHHDESQQHIVLYSSSKGIFKIQYDGLMPVFDEDIEGKVNELLHYGKEIFFKMYLIHAIIDCSSNKTICHIRDIITNSKTILDNAKQGYELASRQFDFDKIRNSLQKEKKNISEMSARLLVNFSVR